LKNGRGDTILKSSFLKLQVSLDVDPDLDDFESIVMNVSSTLTNTTIWFVAALCFIVDIRRDVRTFLPGLLGHLY